MKRLLLVGGGHSHVEVVRRFGTAPPHGADVILVSPERYTSYSGMLPGLIAGHYGYHDCHIDLEALCRAARVTFERAEVTGLELAHNRARFRDGGERAFDLLSLDIGSTPDTASAPGAPQFAVSVKPVAVLLAAWEKMLAEARHSPQSIAIVGGGAGGVELAAAMHHRLQSNGAAASRLSVVTDAPAILQSHPPGVRRDFERLFAERGIALHCACRAVKVEAGIVHFENGTSLRADWIVWATAASAYGWLKPSGLDTDSRGFVSVDGRLRSVSHPHVFAAGDCAAMVDRALPRSGVYAVRQGPPLAENLRRTLAGMPLIRYSPQRRTLALISTGGRHAVASWDGLALSGRWVWRWKDHIDRRFVARYQSTGQG
ncbi:MAG TPA: FAD-dependent oxidoreductase [Burkholderiales bacterium]|nr:FAD-dependent oxidoreductase [Burkholderiales bacterium]